MLGVLILSMHLYMSIWQLLNIYLKGI